MNQIHLVSDCQFFMKYIIFQSFPIKIIKEFQSLQYSIPELIFIRLFFFLTHLKLYLFEIFSPPVRHCILNLPHTIRRLSDPRLRTGYHPTHLLHMGSLRFIPLRIERERARVRPRLCGALLPLGVIFESGPPPLCG